MHLHILFCPTESTAPDGGQLPTAQLALSLSEEEQHRCAGFVHTEIERYGEELEEYSPRGDDGSEDDESGADQSDDDGKVKGKKKGKGRQPPVPSKQHVTGQCLFPLPEESSN